jgi:hypothetical protein
MSKSSGAASDFTKREWDEAFYRSPQVEVQNLETYQALEEAAANLFQFQEV